LADPTKERALLSAMARYQDNLFRLAFSMVRSRMDAEDVLQEVFLKYYQRIAPFSSEEHEKAWLIRVTVNACISLLRNPWRRFAPLLERLAAPKPEEQHATELVQALPPRYAAVIHLYYYEELSVRQISQVLHMPEGTVQSRLARGRKRLEALLLEERSRE